MLGPVAPVISELVLNCFHVPVTQLGSTPVVHGAALQRPLHHKTVRLPSDAFANVRIGSWYNLDHFTAALFVHAIAALPRGLTSPGSRRHFFFISAGIRSVR
jgi:hypothetical protein